MANAVIISMEFTFWMVPIVTLIKERQEEYYEVLGACDKEASSERFIEFSLQGIYDALCELAQAEQVERLIEAIGKDILSSKELMERLQLKHRTTFRDNYLKPAINLGFVDMTIPDKPNSSKQKYRMIR